MNGGLINFHQVGGVCQLSEFKLLVECMGGAGVQHFPSQLFRPWQVKYICQHLFADAFALVFVQYKEISKPCKGVVVGDEASETDLFPMQECAYTE